MNYHLYLVLISILFGACQVKQDIASISESASSSEVSNEFVITTSSNGWKKKNDVIQVTLNSLKKIHKVGGATPYISAIVGNNIRKFNYVSGSGTNAIIFTYTVTSADLDSNGIEFLNTVSLNGTSFKLEDDAGNMVTAPNKLNFKPNEILVDGAPPTLTMLNLPEAKNYVTNDSLTLSMVFNENVRIRQGVSFTAVLTSGNKTLNYFSGNGTKTLLFKTELNSLDSDVDGTIEINELDFTAQITDEAGNPYVDLLLDNAVDNLWVNLPTPKITNVYINSANPPASSTYTSGQTIDIGLKFDQNIVLNTQNGSPKLTLSLNSGIVQGNVLSLAPANQLNFRYTIKSGDLDADGITIPQSIELFGGSLKSATNPSINASLVIPTIDTSMVKVSAPQPLSVIFTNAPYPQVYKLGDNLDFTLFYNRPITVSTTTLPKINLVIGSVAKQATYNASISSSQAAVFRYTVQNTDLDNDGITVAGTITNPTSITDSFGVSSQSTFDSPYSSGIKIDAQVPLISSLSIPESKIYKAGDKLQIVSKMSENTIVSGTPKIKLTIGTIDVDATYLSGSGTKALIFSYDIASGLTDSDGIAVNSLLEMNGGYLQDSNGNTQNTDIAISPSSTSAVLVDATIPTISSIVPLYLSAKNFKKDENIEFNIAYNKPVQVSGFPCIRFFTSAVTFKCARYVPTSSTSSVLRFRYTVAENDVDDDGIVINVPQIYIGINESIKDSAGNSADVDFPATLLTHLKIDAKHPSVTSVVLPPNGNYGMNSNLTFKLNWDEAVTITGTPKLSFFIGETFYAASYLSGSPPSTQSVFQLSLSMSGVSSTSFDLSPIISLESGVEIKDSNGNSANLNFTSPTISGIAINTVKPAVTAVSSTNNGRFKAGDILTFKIHWNKEIIVSTPSQFNLKIQVGSSLKDAQYKPALSFPANGISVHQYTIVAGDTDTDGVTALAIEVSPPIKDTFNNEAVTSFSPTLFSSVLVDTTAPVLDTNVATSIASFKANQVMTFGLVFSEAVKYTGSPYINIVVGSTTRQAHVTSGNGTNVLNFFYTVQPGETDTDGVSLQSPINLGAGGSILDLAGNAPTVLSFTTTATNYKVDTTAPSINQNVYSQNETRASLHNDFISGDVINLKVTFNDNMEVVGVPRLILNIGGVTRYANYNDLLSTDTIKSFTYQISPGNSLLDLNGIEISPTIDLNGGAITDIAGNNPTSYSFTYADKDYVYFSNIVSRYHVKIGTYTFSGSSITKLNDVTGNNHHLEQIIASERPTFSTTGFGTNSTGHLTLSAGKGLRTTTAFSMRYAFFAAKKTPPLIYVGTIIDGLISQSKDTSYFELGFPPLWIQEYTWFETLKLVSTSSTKSVEFDPSVGRVKFNDGTFNLTPVASISNPSLWAANTNYVMVFGFDESLTLEINSIIGATGDENTIIDSFKGDIAEMIFVNGTLNETQINLIRDQLNNIHGIY